MDLIAETCDRVTRPVMPPRVTAAEHQAILSGSSPSNSVCVRP